VKIMCLNCDVFLKISTLNVKVLMLKESECQKRHYKIECAGEHAPPYEMPRSFRRHLNIGILYKQLLNMCIDIL